MNGFISIPRIYTVCSLIFNVLLSFMHIIKAGTDLNFIQFPSEFTDFVRNCRTLPGEVDVFSIYQQISRVTIL